MLFSAHINNNARFFVCNVVHNHSGYTYYCHHVFCELSYVFCGQILPTRHILDAMHCEKSIFKNLLRTLFGETDGAKSREDMHARGIRNHLHLQRNPDGHTYFKPDAPYVLTKEH
jgi:hypothetical protein